MPWGEATSEYRGCSPFSVIGRMETSGSVQTSAQSQMLFNT
jgi:hypothetical protein